MKVTPLALVMGLLVAGCQPGHPPATPTQAPTGTSTPSYALPSIDAAPVVVFTLSNPGANLGIDGAQRPVRLAWGAQGFTIAPDGKVWIADSAAQPARLLHFDMDGVLLRSVPGGPSVVGLIDIAASHDRVWSLWVSSGNVLEMSNEGEVLREVALPEGVEAGTLAGITAGEGGELIADLAGSGERIEILDAQGMPSGAPIAGYLCAGRIFHLDLGITSDMSSVPEGFPVVVIGDVRVPIDEADPFAGIEFLGCDGQGNFFLAVDRFLPGPAINVEQQVRRYSADGVLTGLAHLPQAIIHAPNDLAVGPDGELYAMVSREDYSVDILRMSLVAGLPTGLVETAATATPARRAALLPTWTVIPPGADEMAIARETLIRFFTFLHDGRYAEAADLYGGSYEFLLGWHPEMDPDDGAKLWEVGCIGLYGCQLLAGDIVEAERVSAGEVRFLVEFVTDDGELFVRGPCCGATEAEMPSVWRFHYTVRVIDGEYLVMDMPVYVP